MPFASAWAGSTTGWLEAISFNAVLVQRVLMPTSGAESWTLLGDDGEVVEPAERYLAYLAAIERSPNTVRAYAVSLKLWFEFLSSAKLSWSEVGIEDVARFVAWLRAPAPGAHHPCSGGDRRRTGPRKWRLTAWPKPTPAGTGPPSLLPIAPSTRSVGKAEP
jgi:hypothetical protein